MTEKYFKICTLLASSGFSKTELNEFSKYIIEIGSSRFLKDLEAIKSVINFLPEEVNYSKNFIFSNNFYKKSYSLKSDSSKKSGTHPDNLIFVEKVSNLLLDDSRLSKAEAAKLLYQAINDRHPALKIPNYQKKALALWLEQLQKILSPSEILHIATAIRNHYVIDANIDWNLK